MTLLLKFQIKSTHAECIGTIIINDATFSPNRYPRHPSQTYPLGKVKPKRRLTPCWLRSYQTLSYVNRLLHYRQCNLLVNRSKKERFVYKIQTNTTVVRHVITFIWHHNVTPASQPASIAHFNKPANWQHRFGWLWAVRHLFKKLPILVSDTVNTTWHLRG